MVFQQESHLYVQKKRWFIAQICARLNQINEYDANMMIAMSHPYLNYAVIVILNIVTLIVLLPYYSKIMHI